MLGARRAAARLPCARGAGRLCSTARRCDSTVEGACFLETRAGGDSYPVGQPNGSWREDGSVSFAAAAENFSDLGCGPTIESLGECMRGKQREEGGVAIDRIEIGREKGSFALRVGIAASEKDFRTGPKCLVDDHDHDHDHAHAEGLAWHSEEHGRAKLKASPLMVRSFSKVRSLLQSRLGGSAGAHLSSTYVPEVKKSLGLYGHERLIDARSFETWREEVERDCSALRAFACEELRLDPQEHGIEEGRKVVQVLDSISARLCLLLDTAEVCSSSHSDPVVRSAAAETNGKLSSFVTKLNMDTALYEPLATLVNTKPLFDEMSPEEKRVAVSLKAEFERDGIHLSMEEKAKVEALQARARDLEFAFTQLDRAVTGEIRLSLKESGRLMMESHLLGGVARLDTQSIPPTYVIPVENSTLSTVMRNAGDPKLRKRLFVHAYSKGAERNLQVLKELIGMRKKLANSLGFESWAHFATSYRMAGTPEVVHQFLNDVNAEIAPTALEEVRSLEKLKHERERVPAERLQSWDVSYYTEQALRFEHGSLLDEACQFFPLSGCIQGLMQICKELFDLEFQLVAMDPGESWADGVQKLEVRESDGKPAGVLYLDLYNRAGKFGNPAHFQVRCSHLRRPLGYFSEKLGYAPSEAPGTEYYRLPTSVLVCNFEKGGTLLHHGQVQTLFHEFGHALHSLLSRTEFQHLSGTRGELDFVETPSQLMEYFCFDKRVLKLFALHHRTGEPIPDEIVAALTGARSKFQAMELQQQVMFAACDQVLFGKEEILRSVEDNPQAASVTLSALQNKYSHIPYVEGTFWISRFSHFVNYGAAYYSYTYARAFAADIWHTCFREDPLNRKAGQKLRESIFQHGGSKDPHVMLEEMLGRPTSIDPLITEIKGSRT